MKDVCVPHVLRSYTSIMSHVCSVPCAFTTQLHFNTLSHLGGVIPHDAMTFIYNKQDNKPTKHDYD